MLRIGHQRRAAVDGATGDHDAVGGVRLDPQAGFIGGQRRPASPRAPHALVLLLDAIAPYERKRAAFAEEGFGPVPDVLAVLRACIAGPVIF